MTRTLEEYLDLPYTIMLQRDVDEEGRPGFVAEVRELPGCISQGESVEEAVANVHDAMAGWLSVALEDGREIPEPREPSSYSGKFLLRIPRTLHAALAHQAEEEGVSLNQFVSAALAYVAGERTRVAV
jgi:antitoxin HicB